MTANIESLSQTEANSAFKTRASSFFGWLFGAAPPADSAPSFEKTGGTEFTIEPPMDTNSWVDSFNTALTEATASFILRYVDPLHREDPTIGFSVKKVKVGLRDAAVQCVRAIESMPIAMRNRIVQLRMKKAHGAEQLSFDNFYGLSITAEETLLDGQLIQTMVSYSGSRFVLKFEFEGEYITIPSEADNTAPKASVPEDKVSPITVNESCVKDTEAKSSATSEPIQANSVKDEKIPLERGFSRETVLRLPPREPTISRLSGARETPLNIPVVPHRPIAAKLHLRSLGSETVVDLFEDNFPYAIGRHPCFSGYCVQGRVESGKEPAKLLHDVEPAEYTSYVSRNHVVLDYFDPATRQFNVSATKGKNGTFLNGSTMPKRFILPATSNDWVNLGGENGTGILDIRFETV